MLIGAAGCAVAMYLHSQKLTEAGIVKPVTPKAPASGLSVVTIEQGTLNNTNKGEDNDRNPLGPVVNGEFDQKPVSINNGFKSKY